jgi:hypothetical protein
MSENRYDYLSNLPLIEYLGKFLKGMQGDEFMIVIESKHQIYLKEYSEGDEEEWDEGTAEFWREERMAMVHVPPVLLGMTQAQLNNRFKRKAR